MRVSRESRKLEQQARTLKRTLERLRQTLQLDHGVWADLLKLSQKQYRNFRTGNLHLPAHSLAFIADNLNLSLEQLLKNRIDFRAAAKHYCGELAYIPEKYTLAAFSRRRTAEHALQHLERMFGWEFCLQTLRKFQLNPAALNDLDAPINIIFISEMFHFLRTSGLTSNHLRMLGVNNVDLNLNSPLGIELSARKTAREVYEYMIVDLVSFYEKNCSYRLLKLSNTSCLVESFANDFVLEPLKLRQLGNSSVCEYRAGILQGTPRYIGLSDAQVTELECVHRGDASCKFHVNFEFAGKHHLPHSGVNATALH